MAPRMIVVAGPPGSGKSSLYPVDGELITYAAIGVWYNPRQCLRHRYESRPIDVGSVNSRFWHASVQSGMRSMAVIVMLKIE